MSSMWRSASAGVHWYFSSFWLGVPMSGGHPGISNKV